MATKKMPEWFVKDYEEWKVTLWRAVRAFVAGAVSAMGVILVTVTPDVFNDWTALKKFLIPLGAGALTGGLVAVGKVLRDAFPESAIVQKIPI